MKTTAPVLPRIIHFYLLALLLATGLLYFGPEDVQLTRILAFGPRWLAGAPLMVLLPLACRKGLLLTCELLLCAALIAGLFMGYTLRISEPVAHGEVLRVLNCNLNGTVPDQEEFSGIVLEQGIDVIVLQGCPQNLILNLPSGWSAEHQGKLAIFSRYGLTPPTSSMEVLPWLVCSMRTPSGKVVIANADCNNTAQWKLFPADTRKQPTIIAGNFGMPAENYAFRNTWPELSNVFSMVGKGYGWTEMKTTMGISWGIRSAQILVSADVQPISCEVGPDIGTSHRPLLSELVLTAP